MIQTDYALFPELIVSTRAASKLDINVNFGTILWQCDLQLLFVITYRISPHRQLIS
ncbi:hypothetical protein [Cytobacillus sp.]|uniref:hypothetical protein n=1 Tax=Cytobacillus sp. TaxID=2675269 RepID=UPI0028BE8FF4|nr:hypothetical protein [Cytobacillus sp.]